MTRVPSQNASSSVVRDGELLGEDLGDQRCRSARAASDIGRRRRRGQPSMVRHKAEQHQHAQQAQGVAEKEERMVERRAGREEASF